MPWIMVAFDRVPVLRFGPHSWISDAATAGGAETMRAPHSYAD